MAILVHLADEKEISSIKKNGIKIGKYRRGVYCMPVLLDYYTSHQWLRELRRRGVKTFIAVYFKLDKNTKVYCGHYLGGHQYIELSEAIKEIKESEDALGYELIIDRKIEPKEIHKIKMLPQITGWRISPTSKGKTPYCDCDFCSRGTINRYRIRRSNRDTIIKRLVKRKGGNFQFYKLVADFKVMDNQRISSSLAFLNNEISSLNSSKYQFLINSDPTELSFLLEKNSLEILRELAFTLRVFQHKTTKAILLRLLEEKDSSVMEYAATSLLELYGDEIVETLENYNHITIRMVLKDYKSNNE